MIIKNGKTISARYKGTKEIIKRYKGTLVVYEAWKELIKNGVPPLTLQNCKGVDLIDYKIYGNSVQNGTPTPEAPIEVESVGDKTNNLININAITSPRITIERNSVSVQIYEQNSSTSTQITLKELCPEIEVGKTYKLYFDTDTPNSYISTGAYNTTNMWGSGTTKTITETDLSAIVRIGGGTSTEKRTITLSNIRIVEEGIETEYEPFGYKIPVKVRGKNLVDYTKAVPRVTADKITIDNENNAVIFSGNYYFDIPINIPYGKEVILSLESDYFNMYTLVYEDGNWASYTNLGKSIVTKQNVTKLRIYKSNPTTTENNMIFKNIMLEYGSVSTEYEPYVEPITTNIYLDEPLRKVGEYTDYIEFKNKKIVRLIYNEFITEVSSKSSVGGNYGIFLSPVSKEVKYSSSNGYAQSNKFSQTSKQYYELGAYGGFIRTYVTSGGLSRLAHTFNDTSITTVEQAQEIIGDGFEVNYVLATPTEETIELPNIPTIKGTTILEVGTEIQPSNMEVTYKGKGE